MGYRLKFQNLDLLQSLKNVFILENSADHEEIPYLAAFHLGLHCWPKYPFIEFPVYKGLKHVLCIY